MVKILITGANGFIGSHLCDFLINKNHEVYAIIRPKNPLKNLNQYTNGKNLFSNEEKIDFVEEKVQIPSDNENIKLLECNIKNQELLEKIIYGINPKYIFHLGAQSNVIPSWEDPIETIESNIIGTINVFEPIKKYKIKGGGLTLRFGEQNYTGATVLHLHFHLIVPKLKPKSKLAKIVNFPIG